MLSLQRFLPDMIEIQFPDKTIKSYQEGITPLQIAESISEGLARNVLSANFNGILWKLIHHFLKWKYSYLPGKIRKVKSILAFFCILLKQFCLYILRQN